ncbi:unnamed protein product [Ambrosiozyma monospora]|uniref:Unnamed protein product n=1 Tax=Ambrosiozyma monospora TaxID=43982 RepID=A0ACB5TQU3_AMBMO|nr:unnamed protein product [Ambrosiozyma monospora]
MSYVPPHRSRTGESGEQGAPGGNSFGGNGYRSNGYNNGGYQNSRGGYRGNSNGYGNRNGGYGGGYGGGYRSNGYGGGRGGYNRNNNYGGGYNRNRKIPGQGRWVDGKHEPAERDTALELEYFGEAGDPHFQSSGINFDHYDDIPVEASGENVPEPITEFTSPPIDPLLIENIKLARFSKPTPVQKYSVPIVTGGGDLMACAQTGSGKTGGFLFPVLSQMYKNGPAEVVEDNSNVFARRRAHPTALIIAPTRELVMQIHEEAKKYAYRSWVKACVVYGGASIDGQIRQLERGCDLLVVLRFG